VVAITTPERNANTSRVPQRLEAALQVSQGKYQVALEWEYPRNRSGVRYFELELAGIENWWKIPGRFPQLNYSLTDTFSLEENMHYTFRIRARYEDGSASGYTPTVTLYTGTPTAIADSALDLFDEEESFLEEEANNSISHFEVSARQRGNRQVILSWVYSGARDDVTRFEIERNGIEKWWDSPARYTEITDSYVQTGETYRYRIRAVFSDGTKSEYSSAVEINVRFLV
jgi:hypothetical protein